MYYCNISSWPLYKFNCDDVIPRHRARHRGLLEGLLSHPLARHQIGHHGVKQLLDGSKIPTGRPFDLFDQRIDDGVPAIFGNQAFDDFWRTVCHNLNFNVP